MEKHTWERRIGKVHRGLRTILAALGLLLIAVHTLPLGQWYALRLAGSWGEPKGGVLLVPGAEMEDGRVLGLHSFRRMYYALWYYQRGDYDAIVVLGRDVGDSMKLWLVHYGVPAEAVHVGRQSTSTRENAAEAAAIIRAHPEWRGPFWLLTSDFHQYRACREFARQGLKVVGQPVPDVLKQWESWWLRFDAWVSLSIETSKIGYYTWN